MEKLEDSRDNRPEKMNKTTAQVLESNIQVVHAVPGRVRLHTVSNRLISVLETVAQKLRKQDGVDEVRTNPTTKTLVVTFDASTLPLPQMLEILHQLGVSKASRLLEDKNTQEVSQVSKLDTLWSENTDFSPSFPPVRSFIPWISGMLITGGLGIQGWMAIPVYMVAEGVTREVIKQLESESLKLEQAQNAQEEAFKLNGKSVTVNENHQLAKQQPEVSYSVVHAIPGRIRFRVPRIAGDAEYAHRLTVLTEADAKITSVRINSEAASVAFSYQADGISDDKMLSHLVSLIQSATTVILPIIAAASSQQQPKAESQSWYQLALPALCTTLAILGGPVGLPIPPAMIGGSIALAALPVAQRAIDSILTEQRLNIDCLDLMAITITTLQGQFISPAIMIALVETGEAIREHTARSSKLQTLDLLDSLEQFVWVERNGEKQQISIHEVQLGDTVIVYPGNQIPVDGRILRGKALIDEQKLTGEAMPAMRKKGQVVHASTLVREGQLYIQAEKVGADTRAGQILKVMQAAPVHDTRMENYAAKIADQAVVPTIILSGIVFAATRNFARAASILTLDFATGIRVSVPTTVLAALTYAARRGILIRSGRALEKLAEVDAVVFDKTGTLTQGEAVVVSVATASESVLPLQVLELAAAAEQRLTHPVAEAIVRYAEAQGVKISSRGKWEYQIGLGVCAEIEGQTVLVGSDRFLLQQGIRVEQLLEQNQHFNADSHSVIYVASNGELQGAIAYRDPLRPESRQVIQTLRMKEDTQIHLLTGDNQRTAAAVAHELGIEPTQTHAQAFPEQKVAVVQGLHEQGRTVAFVGDGINDSPALAYADVSVSFANGSDVARETADVVLMENDLRGLPEAMALARQAVQLIHQNTGIVAIPNLTALALAVVVGIEPLAATLVNNGSAVMAGLNGLRPLLLASGEDVDLGAINLDSENQDEEERKEMSTAPGELLTVPDQPQLENVSGVEAEPITVKTLAERLNVSATTISRKKSQPDFPDWTRSKDPDGITWMYSKKSHLFLAG